MGADWDLSREITMLMERARKLASEEARRSEADERDTASAR